MERGERFIYQNEGYEFIIELFDDNHIEKFYRTIHLKNNILTDIKVTKLKIDPSFMTYDRLSKQKNKILIELKENEQDFKRFESLTNYKGE